MAIYKRPFLPVADLLRLEADLGGGFHFKGECWGRISILNMEADLIFMRMIGCFACHPYDVKMRHP
jgi:hypothetical protein